MQAPIGGFASGSGLEDSRTLGYAPTGQTRGSATLGAGLDFQLPLETATGDYKGALTLTVVARPLRWDPARLRAAQLAALIEQAREAGRAEARQTRGRAEPGHGPARPTTHRTASESSPAITERPRP